MLNVFIDVFMNLRASFKGPRSITGRKKGTMFLFSLPFHIVRWIQMKVTDWALPCCVVSDTICFVILSSEKLWKFVRLVNLLLSAIRWAVYTDNSKETHSEKCQILLPAPEYK